MAKKKNSKKKNPKVNEMKDQMIQEKKNGKAEAAEVIEVTAAEETADAVEVTESVDIIEAAEITEVADATAATEVIEAAEKAEIKEVSEPVEAADAAEPTDVVEVADAAEPAEVIDATDAAEPTDVVEVAEAAEPADVIDATDAAASDAVTEVTAAEEPIKVIDTEEPAEAVEKSESAEVTKDTVVLEAIDTTSSPEPGATETPDVIELSGPVADGQTPSDGAAPIAPVHSTGSEEPADTEFETVPEAAGMPVETTALTTVISAVNENSPAADEKKPKKSKFKELFGDKPVSRKFLALSLVAALLLNAGITAGLMGLFTHSIKKDIEKVSESVNNPGPWDLFDHDRGDQGNGMTPPDWNNGNGFDRDWDDDDQYGNDWGDDDQYGNDWDDDDRDDDSGIYPWSGQQEDNNQLNQPPQQDQQNASKVSIGIVISENNGVYITQVTGNNAQKAGFQTGDKIVSFDGKTINDSNSLISEVQKHKAGDNVKVVVERNGKETTIKTTLE